MLAAASPPRRVPHARTILSGLVAQLLSAFEQVKLHASFDRVSVRRRSAPPSVHAVATKIWIGGVRLSPVGPLHPGEMAFDGSARLVDPIVGDAEKPELAVIKDRVLDRDCHLEWLSIDLGPSGLNQERRRPIRVPEAERPHGALTRGGGARGREERAPGYG